MFGGWSRSYVPQIVKTGWLACSVVVVLLTLRWWADTKGPGNEVQRFQKPRSDISRVKTTDPSTVKSWHFLWRRFNLCAAAENCYRQSPPRDEVIVSSHFKVAESCAKLDARCLQRHNTC